MNRPFRDLGVNLHLDFTGKADPDDVLELSLAQSEARLQQEMVTDKIRAVKQNAAQIKKTKDFLKKARKDSKAQKLLQKQLENLEQEQFELLRDEILNECKDSAGLIDEAKLARFPGSSGFIKKNLKRNKPKN